MSAICWPCLPAAAIAVGLGAFGGALPPVVVLAVLAGVLAIQTRLEVLRARASDAAVPVTGSATA